MLKKHSRVIFLLFFLLAIASFFIFDLNQYFSLEYIKARQGDFINFYAANKYITVAIYFLLYVLVTALSLPGAAVMTLLAGALFGFFVALILVSFASTIGATLAFLISRFMFKDYVERKFSNIFKAVNEGVKKEGAFYLFALRLVPIFPFFLINIVMGITAIGVGVFYLASQIGMFLGTVLYVYAGTQLAAISSLKDISSPRLILVFTLLGVFPLLIKRFLSDWRFYRLMRKFKKPAKFDYNVVVIGAGSGGLVASYIGSFLQAKVALVEKENMGGDCLNTGCIPSKALIRSTKILSYFKRANEFGIAKAEFSFNFKDIMHRVRRIVEKIAPHDSVERYEKLGIKCIKGEAVIDDPYRVKVNDKILTTKNIIIAAGASPFIPPIPGLDKIDYLTSDNVWDLEELPQKLLVLGGGPLGCELAQSFARLGSQVTIVEMAPQILTREDPEISSLVVQKFKDDGIKVLAGHKAKTFIVENDNKYLICDHAGQDVKVEFDEVLVAIGRRANVKGYGLESIGVELTERGAIEADQFLRTNFPNIYVCGDAVGPYQFTHTASHQAKYAISNALFRPFKKFKVDLRVVPWATFTDPEIARVGLNEKEAKSKNIKYRVATYPMSDLDRAIADSEDYGLIKVLTKENSDKILGVTIAGYHASDCLSEFVLAMQQNIGLSKILDTIHVYPTISEVNKNVAGAWKKGRVSAKTLKLLEKFNDWRRK